MSYLSDIERHLSYRAVSELITAWEYFSDDFPIYVFNVKPWIMDTNIIDELEWLSAISEAGRNL